MSAAARATATAAPSTNWAGYVAVPSTAVGSRFTTVSGSWTQPAATCAQSGRTYSAVWVGLGGYGESATALEQIGTDVNCTRSGDASYSSWYELVPAAPVDINLAIRPGDRIVTSVTVRSHDVTLRLRNLTSSARFSTTRRVAETDVTSADWIVEAPSLCLGTTTCATLPLTDFGTVSFSSATATAAGHTGTISDTNWSAASLELEQDLTAVGSASAPVSSKTATAAAPSSVSGASGSFSVTWLQRQIETGQLPASTLPGPNGGAPEG
jgi:hypothetical protein